MLNYEELVPDRSAVLRVFTLEMGAAQHDGQGRSRLTVAENCVRLAAANSLSATLHARCEFAREAHEMAHGKRPQALGQEMNLWDRNLNSSLLAVFEDFAAKVAGYSDDEVSLYYGHLLVNNPGLIEKACWQFAIDLIGRDLAAVDTAARRLSRLGFVSKDFEAMPEVPQVPLAAAQDLFENGFDLGVFGTVSGELGPQGLDKAEEPRPPRPRTKRGKPVAGIPISSTLFKKLREAGISDSIGGKNTGISHSTWSRLATGTATEITFEKTKVDALTEWLAGLHRQLGDLRAELDAEVQAHFLQEF